MADSAALARVSLFAGLPVEELDLLAARLRRRRYARGEVVFLQGDPGTNFCIVETGRVKLGFTSPEGREVLLDLVGPAGVFGEMALLDGEPRSADAVAVEPSELLLLQRDDFVGFLLERPRVMLQLIAMLSRRLRRDAQLMQDSAFLDVPARLARTLLRLGEKETPGGERITPRLTQSDLAGLVGTTRETLNLWLGFFERQGLIRRDKGKIVLLQPDGLQQRIY
jgi:CRP/FNR family cyclic AMP-dependent transcriptional regulator